MAGQVRAQIIQGMVHPVQISDPVVHVDNQARRRSGHMSHALAEVKPGRLLDFQSNCSRLRLDGHSAFGWVEYRYSDDGGETYGETYVLPYSMETLLEGINSISLEKAVVCGDGTVVAFCLRNDQSVEVCCEPYDTPMVIRSQDGGLTWSEPEELCGFRGRVYDALYRDGSIYVLEFCNEAVEHFTGTKPEHQYRLFKSDDAGQHFYEQSVVGFPSAIGYGYGSMIFTPEGKLIVYAYDLNQEDQMPYAVSEDLGKTWCQVGSTRVAKKIRNPQVGLLDGQFLLHGRGSMHDFVFYTSADGIVWDEGVYLNANRGTPRDWDPCYYSNNIVLDHPGKPGKKRMLIQYSEVYERNCVNVMHLWVETVDN